MIDSIEINRESFYKLIKRQSNEWNLIDSKIIEEESNAKKIKPKKEKKWQN